VTESGWKDSEEFSLLALGATLLRNRWRIARWGLAGATIAALIAFTKAPIYLASASFIPQNQSDPTRSGLANLAGQFGVALPGSNQALSPEFYSRLLKSRELLIRVAADTIVVREKAGRRIPFLDLFEISGPTERARQEQGVRVLTGTLVNVSVAKPTGVVELSVGTRWPSVSLAIVTDLINGVNDFNQRMRQEQAGAERRFVEGRLEIAGADLRASEDRLEDFLRNNRQFANSPDLTFQRDRLQRDLTLKQQMFTTLTQSYEEVRIREVRDTPVITVVESPSVPTLPESRRRGTAILLGLVFGAFIGAIVGVTSETVTRRSEEGDAEAHEFVGSLVEVKDDLRGRLSWFKGRIAR